jgi:hypothetical protein
MNDDTATTVEDLFADDDATALVVPAFDPSAAYPGTVAEFKDVARIMSGDEVASFADGVRDDRAGIVKAARAELHLRTQPAVDTDPAFAGPIDNAVRIRKIDWECVCGNTNTHDLRMCGKCRAHRYTN